MAEGENSAAAPDLRYSAALDTTPANASALDLVMEEASRLALLRSNSITGPQALMQQSSVDSMNGTAELLQLESETSKAARQRWLLARKGRAARGRVSSWFRHMQRFAAKLLAVVLPKKSAQVQREGSFLRKFSISLNAALLLSSCLLEMAMPLGRVPSVIDSHTLPLSLV